ncbi:MAG: TonB-dependent siderophore receptor [Bacteroidetes bacterium]|nr:TonB-dependent siderophore receptor [Bacteroidota bacterium]
MRKWITPFVLLLLAEVVHAQKNSGALTGKIITPDKNPADVTVELKSLKRVTVTDRNGSFLFQHLPAFKDTLIITSAGSDRFMQAVAIGDNQTVDLGTIEIHFNIVHLQNVEVKGRISNSYKSDYSFLSTKTQTSFLDIPQSISSITKEMIADKMEFTVKDAADEAAGVNHYSGFDDFTIRGFKAENARLINGLRGYNTTYTSTMLVNVERIEVVKGPSATLYGNCDPGGTINLVTKKPLSTNEGSISISGGTWNHFRALGDITGPVNKNKTLLYRFNAGYDETHSFRDLFYAKSFELAPSVSYIPNDRIQLNVDLSVSHINTILDRGQPGIQNNYSLASTPVKLIVSQPGNYLHETDIATSILFSYKINKRINFNSGYLNYITQQNTAEHGVHSYITPDSVNLYYTNWKYHTTTHTFNEYFTFHFNTGKLTHQLLAGYDLVISDVNLDQKYFEDANRFGSGSGIAGTFSLLRPVYATQPVDKYQQSSYNTDATNVEASVYHTQGIYIQEQASWKKWKFLFGLREELYSAGDDDDTTDQSKVNILMPRVGIVYTLSPIVNLYATYNKGFDPFEASTSTQIFNAPFKPVTSDIIEAGAKANLFHNKLAATLSLYQLTLHNVAVNANDISDPNLYVQQGEDRSRGVETEIDGDILPNLSIAASYSYCVAKVIKSKIASQVGTLVENAPENMSNSWIKYVFSRGLLKGFGVAAGHSQVGWRNTLETGLTLPGYILLNAGIRYSYDHFNIALNLNNITDKTYWLGAYNNVSKWPGAPRNFMVRAEYRF